MKRFIGGLVAAFIVWLGLVIWVPTARQGRAFILIPGTFGDFFFPRISIELNEPYKGMPDVAEFSAMKAERGWCDRRMLPFAQHIGKAEDLKDGFPDSIRRVDCCYPALALALIKPFPVSFGGGFWVMTLGALSLMAGLVLCARRIGLSTGWCVLAGVVAIAAVPTIRAFERGNLILFAAAGVAVFLAWYDSERPWKRIAAALALAFAFALKLTPAVFAVLYIRREKGWRGLFSRELFLFGGLALLLLLVPFIWFGAFEGIRDWLANASTNGREYMPYGTWGLVRLHRAWLSAQNIYLNYSVLHPYWPWFHLVEIVIGVAALVLGWWRRDLVLLAAFLLLAPGNMMAYGGVYLLPVMMMSRPTRFEYLLWFIIFCPLQLVIGTFTLNTIAVIFAFWALIGGRVGSGGSRV